MSSNSYNSHQPQFGDGGGGHPTGESLEQLHARGVRLNVEFMDDYLAGRPLPPGLQAHGLPIYAHGSRTDISIDESPKTQTFGQYYVPPPSYYLPPGPAQYEQYGYQLVPGPTSHIMPNGLQQPSTRLLGHQMHHLGEQQRTVTEQSGTSAATAIQIDEDLPPHPPPNQPAAPNSTAAAGPQPRPKRLKIVHTCEPADTEFLTRYKVGTWTDLD